MIKYSLNFLFISTVAIVSILYFILTNTLPGDIYLGVKQYKTQDHFFYQHSFKRRVICPNVFYNSQVEKAITDPDSLFENTSYLFKSKYKDKKVAVVKFNDQHFIAHKFTSSGLLKKLSQLLGQSSAGYRAWHYGQILARGNIPATRPLLIIEKRWGPFCFTSYVLTSYVTGMTGSEFFSDSSPFKELWPEATTNLIKTINQLSQCKIWHYNFSIHNCVFKKEVPYLIDLEKLHLTLSYSSLAKIYTSSINTHLKNYSPCAQKIFFEQMIKQSF